MNYDVLHVINDLYAHSGGPTEALCGLATAQARAGMRVAVVTSFRKNVITEARRRLEAADIPLTRIGPTSGPLSRHPDMPKVLREQVAQARIVHIHGVWEQLLYEGSRAARAHHIPYVWRPCGMLDPWSLQQSRLKKKLMLTWRVRRALNAASALHFTSNTEAASADHLGLKPPRIVEPNGIHFDAVTWQGRDESAATEVARRWPLLAARPVVLFLGRLHPKKSPDLLIEAYARLIKDWPEAKQTPVLVLAGSGDDDYLATLIALARHHGMTVATDASELDPQARGLCFFSGMLTGDDKALAFQAADLFALPSQQENFGIAAAEAMGSGTAVLISPEVDLSHFVQEHETGRVVQRDSQHWADMMQTLLLDPKTRNELGRRGQRAVRAAFDWDDIASRWKAHYEQLIDAFHP